jgi:hypothetical protein
VILIVSIAQHSIAGVVFQAKFLWQKAAQSTQNQTDVEDGLGPRQEVNSIFTGTFVIISVYVER